MNREVLERVILSLRIAYLRELKLRPRIRRHAGADVDGT